MHKRSCFQVLKSGERIYVNSEHTERAGVQGILIEVFLMAGKRKTPLKKQFLKHNEVRKKGGLKVIREDLFERFGDSAEAA